MKKLVITLFVFLVTFPILGRAETWKIDPDHSTARFSIRHMAIAKVHGSFSDVSGWVELDDKGRVERLVLSIGVASINTGVEKRDAHLRSTDFFDAAGYPTINFVSKRVIRDDHQARIVGDLMIHGVTREVVVDLVGPTPEVEDPWGNVRMGLELKKQINRKEFGIAYNQTLKNGSLLIGDLADTVVELEVILEK